MAGTMKKKVIIQMAGVEVDLMFINLTEKALEKS